jgi:hypothetical protein
MSNKMLLLYVKKTKNIMAAVTLAAPPPGQVKVEEIAGTALNVRYGLDDSTPPKPIPKEVRIPSTELDVLLGDSDPEVLADPHSYQLDSSNQPALLQPPPSLSPLQLSPLPHGVVHIVFAPPAAPGDVIWLCATSDEQEPKTIFATQDLPGVAPIPSFDLTLPGSPSGNYVLLCLSPRYRPTMATFTLT